MSDQARELLVNMKSTAASRYNAAKRLESREQGLTRLTSFTSAYVIALTVLPYFLKLPSGAADRMNLLTLGLGVVILVASLLQYSSRDSVNAEQHYRCGLEIGELRRRLKISAETITGDELSQVADQYALILQKYSINHDQIDYEQYQIERREEYSKLKWIDRQWLRLRIGYSQQVPNLALVGATILVLWLMAAIVVPAWSLPAAAATQQ